MLREYHEPKDFASFVYLSQVQQAEIIKIGAEHLRRQRPRTMGSLYWQLNDCWPVASWASVVSDKLQPLSATIHMRLLDFSGTVLLEQTKDVQIPAQSNAIYFSVDKSALAAKGDLRKSFLVFDLEMSGKRVSRNLIFFDRTQNLELPVLPKIETNVSKTGDAYIITLQSAKLARSVYLAFGDLDVQASDNYFDLLPGETATITLKSPATLDQIKGGLKVTSLTDAFASN
jgi:beta-mannosidase